MKYGRLIVLTTTLIAQAAWAGDRIVSPAPALGEVGLVALGVGLVSAGVAFLRKR